MPKRKLMMKQEDKKVDEVFEEFITYSRAKNLSDRTIVYYKNNYRRFKQFLEEKGIKDISEIRPALMQSYILYLQSNIDNAISINTILRAIRAFLNYAMKFKYLDNFKIELLKTREKVKETYSDHELNLLLEKPDIEKCSFSEYRSWVMVNWFLSTGNRIKTVRNIRIKDLDFQEGFIRLIETKNRKQQLIPLTKPLINILKEYLQFRKGQADDYLFCSIYGEKLSTNAVVQSIRRYNRGRGVSKTSSHLFRHTFAKLWIKNGGDIFRLQRILGHSSIEMVRKYVNMFSEDLKEDFEKFNPLSQYVQDKGDIIKLRNK